MWNVNRETFIGCDREFEESQIVLFGAPYDSTTSYRPGARFGGKAIRSESYGLETYSPYLDRDLEDRSVFDAGELDLSIGDSTLVLAQIKEMTSQIIKNGKLPFMFGGEHLVTLGAFQAIYEEYPEVCVIQFDAHADLREDYLGVQLSHACVMRRIWELVGDERIYQFGIRSGEKQEFLWAKEHTCLNPFDLENLDSYLPRLMGKPVYVTIDLDVFDPSVFPGTGTPEAGGVNFLQLREALEKLSVLHIVGCDVTELAPNYDSSGVSSAVACKVVRELLLSLPEK